MKNITKENTTENMEHKDGRSWLEPGSCTDHNKKDSDFSFDYSVHNEGDDIDEQNHSSENLFDYSVHKEGDDHDKQKHSSENPPSKDVDSSPVQCTEDKLQRLSDEKCSKPEAKDCQQAHVTVWGDDIDLPHATAETGQSECDSPDVKVSKLKWVADIIFVRAIDNDRVIWKLMYGKENGKLSVPNQVECVERSFEGIKPLLEEKTNRKLSQPDQAECMESSPLDIKPFLRVRRTRQEVIVFMQHGYTAQVSSPNTGKQPKDDMTPPKQHFTEFSRLATYIEYPLSLPFFAITLARDGFIYKSDELSIECFFCKLRISLSELRNPGADPVKTHSSKSPACPLKRGDCSGNVPVPRVDENGTLSSNPSHENGGTNAHSSSDTASGSRDNPGERPQGSWYHGDEATVLPSPVIHHNPAPDITTDCIPSEQQVQKLPSPRSNTGRGVPQPGSNDGSVQQPSLQRPNPPPSASSTRTADNAPSLQRSEDAAAPANQKASVNGGARNRDRPGSSPPGSGQNGAAGSSSSPSRPSASATANPSRNPKSSKKTKAAKRADAASRRTAANSSASGSNVPAPAQNSSNKNDGGAPSDKGEKDKEKKKLTYEDLGIFAEKPKRPDMAVLSKRLGTFEGKWKTSFAKTPQTLAECGMYYAGYADCARCFFCGGGLKNWEAPDEPWIEHARWFPKCAYILLHKGSQFVEIVQKKNKSNQKIIMKDVEEEMKSKSSDSSVPLPASGAVGGNGENAARSRGSSDRMNAVADLAKLEAENEELLAQVTCKICMDAKSSVVFLPCGHMVACTDCAIVLKNCPLCRADIRGSVKAQI